MTESEKQNLHTAILESITNEFHNTFDTTDKGNYIAVYINQYIVKQAVLGKIPVRNSDYSYALVFESKKEITENFIFFYARKAKEEFDKVYFDNDKLSDTVDKAIEVSIAKAIKNNN